MVSYPEGSDKPGWAPANWDHGGFTDYDGEPIEFSWPRRRNYFSAPGAHARAALFRKYGAEVVVDVSEPIVWPEP